MASEKPTTPARKRMSFSAEDLAVLDNALDHRQSEASKLAEAFRERGELLRAVECLEFRERCLRLLTRVRDLQED